MAAILALEGALFNKSKVLEVPVKDISIPSNTFGVFVTVKRYNKLPKWPEDIHGCMGYWDPQYKHMKKEDIITKILSVSWSATFDDDRASYFPSIFVDLYSEYEVTFMLSPILNIDEDGRIEEFGESKSFDNEKYGVIVSDTKNRATYLPKVFSKDTSYDEISSSLLKKAGLTSGIFFAYNTKIESISIAKYLLSPVRNFFNKYYKGEQGSFLAESSIPYSIINNKVIYDKSEDIRNIATIYDILRLRKYGYSVNEKVLNSIKRDVEEYSRRDLSSQALSFLLLVIDKLDSESKNIKIFSEKLYKRLKFAEPEFERGEILDALNKVYPKKDILKEEREKSYKILLELKNNLKIESIFHLNWLSKTFPKEHISLLYKSVSKCIDMFPEENLETNYYAVAYECLTTIYKVSPKEKGIDEYIEKVFLVLILRRNNRGLYKFLANPKGSLNSNIRIDITGHVIEGIFNLLDTYSNHKMYSPDSFNIVNIMKNARSNIKNNFENIKNTIKENIKNAKELNKYIQIPRGDYIKIIKNKLNN